MAVYHHLLARRALCTGHLGVTFGGRVPPLSSQLAGVARPNGSSDRPEHRVNIARPILFHCSAAYFQVQIRPKFHFFPTFEQHVFSPFFEKVEFFMNFQTT